MPVILSSIMLEVGKVPVQKISSLKSKFWSKNYCSVKKKSISFFFKHFLGSNQQKFHQYENRNESLSSRLL